MTELVAQQLGGAASNDPPVSRLRRLAQHRPALAMADLLERLTAAAAMLKAALDAPAPATLDAAALTRLAVELYCERRCAHLAPTIAASRAWSRRASQRNLFIIERFGIIQTFLRENLAQWPLVLDPTIDDDVSRKIDRLAQMILQIFNADHCALYRYNALEQTLDRLGLFPHAAPGSSDRVGDYRRIREIGREPERRTQTLNYRAVDLGQVVRDDHERDDDAGGRARGSAMAGPIMLFDRPWGVLELVGRRPGQFAHEVGRWSEETARLIGLQLYYEWTLSRFRAMESITYSDHPAIVKFAGLAKEIAGLFMASSAALYLRHPRLTGTFDCVGQVGRVPESAALPGFTEDDPTSVSAGLLRERGSAWCWGEIGRPPFDAAWQAKEGRARLSKGGHRYIAILVIRGRQPAIGSTEDRVGTITLTAREPGAFGPRLEQLVNLIGPYAWLLVDAVRLEARKDARSRELIAHALKGRANRVEGAAGRFLKAVDPLFGQTGDAAFVPLFIDGVERLAGQHRQPLDRVAEGGSRTALHLRTLFDPGHVAGVRKIVEDVRLHADDLRNIAAYLSGDGPYREHPLHANAATWRGTWARLRASLLASIAPVRDQARVEIKLPTTTELPSSLVVRIPPLLLSEILNNLIDNAIKYRAPGSSVIIRYHEPDPAKSSRLDIRNVGPPLLPHERAEIFKPGFRGRAALDREVDGQGKGLFFSLTQAERWGLQLDHREEATGRAGELVWHSFVITISADCRKNPYRTSNS